MKAGNDPASVAVALLYLLYGPLIWAGHLFLVYVPQSLLCAFRISAFARIDSWLIQTVIGLVTLFAAAALVLALWRPQSCARLLRATAFLNGENAPFMLYVMRLLSVLSLAGVLWAGATALLLLPCPQLR